MVGVPRLILIKDAKGQTITSYFDGKLEPHDFGASGDKDLAAAVLKRLTAMRKNPWVRKNMKNIIGFSVCNREVVSLRNKQPRKIIPKEGSPREIAREDVRFTRQLLSVGVWGP